jgi:hypothetical protein
LRLRPRLRAYQHILDIYRRIEDWQGVADPQRRSGIPFMSSKVG